MAEKTIGRLMKKLKEKSKEQSDSESDSASDVEMNGDTPPKRRSPVIIFTILKQKLHKCNHYHYKTFFIKTEYEDDTLSICMSKT